MEEIRWWQPFRLYSQTSPRGTHSPLCQWGPLAEDWEALDRALSCSGGSCWHRAVRVRGADPQTLVPMACPFFTVWKCSCAHHRQGTHHPGEETKAEELEDGVTLLVSPRGGVSVDRAWAWVPHLSSTALSCVPLGKSHPFSEPGSLDA